MHTQSLTKKLIIKKAFIKTVSFYTQYLINSFYTQYLINSFYTQYLINSFYAMSLLKVCKLDCRYNRFLLKFPPIHLNFSVLKKIRTG